MSEAARQRIDKWLWFARLAKSRTLAQKIVAAGDVRINREKVDSASRLVKAGDTLTIAVGRGVRVLRVVAPGTRRGPASEARLLYQDVSPPAAGPTATGPRAGGARPTKRERRALDAVRRRDDFSSSRD